MSLHTDYSGFDAFQKVLSNIEKNISYNRMQDILEVGAKEFTNDLLALPNPRSSINKSGYTHLVDKFCYEKNDKGIGYKVGWGKYYGPILENGSYKMDAQKHFKKTFDANSKKYYEDMTKQIFE